jgi:hypothetical protein
MQFTLNGWRRIGFVLVSIWIVTLSFIVFDEYSSGQIGSFVERKVTLPNGRTFSAYQVEQFKLRYAEEQKKGIVKNSWDDWDIDFDKYPRVTEVHWRRLGIALLIPMIVWLFAEVAVLTVSWVRRGFARDS